MKITIQYDMWDMYEGVVRTNEETYTSLDELQNYVVSLLNDTFISCIDYGAGFAAPCTLYFDGDRDTPHECETIYDVYLTLQQYATAHNTPLPPVKHKTTPFLNEVRNVMKAWKKHRESR